MVAVRPAPQYPPGRASGPRAGGPRSRALASHGLTYNPPPVSPRSLDAQRLGEHARSQGLYVPFFERTMDAYWAEAQDIGDHGALRRLAAEVGVEGVDEILESDAYTDTVRRSTADAHAVGINGIPAFLLDQRLLVLGAHPRETFERAFEQLGS